MNEKVIMLIEDNADDEALTIRALDRNKIGNEVVVARDGAEALDYLFGLGSHKGRDTSVLPQLVLLDLKLPKVDGFEVLRKIKSDERTQAIPVVVLTSSNEERDLVDSYKLGVNSYIVKPVVFDKFLEAVKQLGMYWVLVNRGPGHEPPSGLR